MYTGSDSPHYNSTTTVKNTRCQRPVTISLHQKNASLLLFTTCSTPEESDISVINDSRPRPPQAILTNFAGLLPSILPWQKDGRADVDFLRQEFGDMEVPVSTPCRPVRPGGGRTTARTHIICFALVILESSTWRYQKQVVEHYVPRLVLQTCCTVRNVIVGV